ncbi:MAG: DUF615 domain-containing protein [Proteobacteria bacterium]|nr:DUF615 domain-containing protein [Pseudomonadota bacterium]
MDEPISKSQKKRDADALKKLGVKLTQLKLEKLNQLPLDESLYQAILQAKEMKSHGAIKRQAQLIGKLMRASDFEVIIEAYQGLAEEENAQTQTFHLVEVWRERLIVEGKEALTEFINQYPNVDNQQLRQLIKKAVDEKEKGKDLGAYKALFRFLRTIIV